MKKLLIAIISISLLFILSGCSTFKNPDENYCVAGNKSGVYTCQKTLVSYFDTTISLKLYVDNSDTYNIEDVFNYFTNTFETYNNYFDNYHEYTGIVNVYTINHSSGPVTVNDQLFEALKYVLDNENINDYNGIPLFDIALGPVTKIWHDARESTSCDTTIQAGVSYCPVPSDQLSNQTFNINPNDIILDSVNKTVEFTKPNMAIDLGGFAKGYVTEIVAEHLDSLNATYILNAGNSNIRVGGMNKNNDTGNFIIALIKPSLDVLADTEFYAYVQISNGMNLVTSGNYQRFFIGLDDLKVYHHIIDPHTLYPGGDVMAVTVFYDNAAMADIMSTAIYLMPLNEAKTFVEGFMGLEAIWYLNDGTYEYSSGFGQYLYNLSN